MVNLLSILPKFTNVSNLICCLFIQVRWEDATDCNSQNRVSPWEIEIVGGSISVAHSLSASSSKRTKLCPQGNLDVPALCEFQEHEVNTWIYKFFNPICLLVFVLIL